MVSICRATGLDVITTGVVPKPVYDIDLLSRGPEGLADSPGISMDKWDRDLYYGYFVKKQHRNPTIVEIMDLNNANSQHSRHRFFRGRQIIDDVNLNDTLFDLITTTLDAQSQRDHCGL